MLNACIAKINEVAQDLREPQDGADLEHQAKKLDRVRDDLKSLLDLLTEQPKKPDAKPLVHGGGTGVPQGPKD